MCSDDDSSDAELNADVDQSNVDESPAAPSAPVYPARYFGRPSRYYQARARGERKSLKDYNILVPSNIVINLDGSVEAGNDNAQGVKSDDSEDSSQSSVNQADIDQNYEHAPQDIDNYSSDVDSLYSDGDDGYYGYGSGYDGYYQPRYGNGYDGYYQPRYGSGYGGYYQPRNKYGYGGYKGGYYGPY